MPRHWYCGATRQERVLAAIAQNELAALLALTPENAAYLSGRTSTIATLWRLPGLVAVAINGRGSLAVAAGDNEIAGYEAAAARFAHPLWIEHLDLRATEGGLFSGLRAARSDGVIARPAQFDVETMLDAIALAGRAVASAGGRIGTEMAALPAWLGDGLRRRLPGFELVEAEGIFQDLRAIKDQDEIHSLRLAAELTELGIAAARDSLRPGMSALGVTAAYQTAIWQAAASDERFAMLRDVEGLVAVGDGSGPARVGPGQTVKLDMQVDVGGYHSDVGRTYALAPTPEQESVFAALHDALDAAIAAMAPGVPIRDLWSAGADAMRRAGFTNYSRGHLGHSVGLAHNYEEPPFIAADEARPFAPGMVVSVELPYYLLGVGTFQLERMVHIGESSVELLDRLPFAFDAGMASSA